MVSKIPSYISIGTAVPGLVPPMGAVGGGGIAPPPSCP